MTDFRTEQETNLGLLLKIAIFQSWIRLDGRYSEGYLINFAAGNNAAKTLKNPNRKTSIQLAKYGKCIVCGKTPSKNSTGDHIIPLSDGGENDATNYWPMCRNDNSSKGQRDFAEWFIRDKKRDIFSIDKTILADVLCSYARLKYIHLLRHDKLHDSPEPGIRALHDQLIQTQPLGFQMAMNTAGCIAFNAYKTTGKKVGIYGSSGDRGCP